MKSTFLQKQKSTKLIMFFNGWGMDERAVADVKNEGFDIVMIHEYHNLEFDTYFLNNYTEIYVVAWSLGVWVAQYVLQTYSLKITKTIAINGTIQAIDNQCGIPSVLFQSTIDNWDEHGRTKFQLRMFKDRSLFGNNLNKLPIRNISEQKNELIALQDSIKNHITKVFMWDKVFIGSDDLIFSFENQKNAWTHTEYIVKPMPHFPFTFLTSWQSIIA